MGRDRIAAAETVEAPGLPLAASRRIPFLIDETRHAASLVRNAACGKAGLRSALLAATASLFALLPPASRAADWPAWGGTPSRNMVSPEKDLPASADVGKARDAGPDQPDPAAMKNVKWVARLGSVSYGNATVAGGRVFIGTNNAAPRSPRYKGDFGVLLCLDEATGKFLWQLAVPKLKAGNASDYSEVGLCSSPTVDRAAAKEGAPAGDRVYLVTNRCEVLCLDAAGKEGDADILWRYDMRDELGVFPHEITSSSVLVAGDRLYVTTSNGVDWTNRHVPSPHAPALICLDKKNGKLLGREKSDISARTFYCNWSSPSLGAVGGRPTLVFGGGDGFCYGFDPDPAPDGTLKEWWRFDCNPPERKTKDGKPQKYGDLTGPSEILGTPVISDGKVFVATGQDPEHGDGAGCLSCIDASDPAGPKAAWQNKDVGRSMSTVAVAEGLVYFADSAGRVYCLDAQTGKPYWTHDLEAHVWGSTLVADQKVYVGDENGEVEILAAGKQQKERGKIDLGQPVYSTPVAANGVLFVATGQSLYALTTGK